ncbi:MAG TPA: hypothetical protein VE820_08195 [Sphingomicrobium sp.]|nr:hypothetical protein [Sphingomicrobium sp.]
MEVSVSRRSFAVETLGTGAPARRLASKCSCLIGISMDYDQVVAVGLLTRNDVRLLGPSFDRLWPVEEAPHFSDLLKAIDEADRRLRNERALH